MNPDNKSALLMPHPMLAKTPRFTPPPFKTLREINPIISCDPKVVNCSGKCITVAMFPRPGLCGLFVVLYMDGMVLHALGDEVVVQYQSSFNCTKMTKMENLDCLLLFLVFFLCISKCNFHVSLLLFEIC